MINSIGILIGGANQLSLYFKKIIKGFQARVFDNSGIFESFDCMDSSLKTITKPIYEQASLVLTPNGYKEDKLYSAFPKDGSGDLVVTRATTATRVNSDGLIEQVPYNFLQQSQTFDNAAWNKLSVGGASIPVVTANSTTAPDGNLTADKIVFNAPTSGDISVLDQNISLTGTATGSFYIKAFSSTDIGKIIGFRFNSGSYSLVTLTDSWQRVSVTATALTTFDIHLRPVIGTSSGTVSIYLWGAQLVEGTSAKDYFPTTDRLDVPRLDYTGGSCPSILVEPQRTNLLQRSEEFDNVYWLKYRLDLVTNTQVSPSGVQNADTFTSSAGQSSVPAIATTSITFSGNTRYSYSIYAKKIGTTDSFVLGYVDNSTGYTGGKASYNLTTQSITITQSPNSSVTASMESVGNGWYKLVLNFLTIATPTYNYVEMSIPSTSITNTFSIWGAQLEAGSYATSYIPTVGSTVTRNADVISKTGISNLIGQTDGTMFFDIVFPQKTEPSYIGISGDSGRIILGCESDTFYTFGYTPGTVLSLNVNTRYKIAMAYNSTNMKIYANGALLTTLTGTMPSGTLSRFAFDSGGGIQNLIASVNTCALFKTKLSDSELATLTTI